ncbi:DNA-directed RNA polymerase III subunit RPC6, partial [Stegodyphus mimosarum]
KLSVQDTEKILESLIYDGKLEKSKALGSSSISKDKVSENFYKVTKSVISSTGLMRMPCGVCTVFNNCGP